MRFALLEAKVCLIEVLKKLSFVRTPDTQVGSMLRNYVVYLHSCMGEVLYVSDTVRHQEVLYVGDSYW